jgi:hypothetical protein
VTESKNNKSVYNIERENPGSPNAHILESKIIVDKAHGTVSQELGHHILNNEEAIKRNAELLVQTALASKPDEPLPLNFSDSDLKETLIFAKAINEALAHANPHIKIEIECANLELKNQLIEVFKELLKNTPKPTNFQNQ